MHDKSPAVAFAVAFAASALIASGVAATEPFSLTGSYEGVFACDDLTEGVPSGLFAPVSVNILQQDGQIDLASTYEDLEGPETLLYRGEVRVDSGGDAISGYFAACGGTFPSNELARIFPAATAGNPFRFAADSIFQTTEGPGLPGQLVVESCRYVLERVSTEPPDLEVCD